MKRSWIEPNHPDLSIRHQCELLQLNLATFYRQPGSVSAADLALMRRIDEQFLQTPFYGSRRIAQVLGTERSPVNRNHMRRIGLEAIHPKPRTTQRDAAHKIYPYLLRNLAITWPKQVWSCDITYVPTPARFMYLTAVIDWFSRYVLAWGLSNTLDGGFCVEALDSACTKVRPEIFNTDQGVQFTSRAFISRLESKRIAISMDGRGRALDNVFIERLWWSV